MPKGVHVRGKIKQLWQMDTNKTDMIYPKSIINQFESIKGYIRFNDLFVDELVS